MPSVMGGVLHLRHPLGEPNRSYFAPFEPKAEILEMMSQKSRRAKDEASREAPDKGVTFTSSGSWAEGKKAAAHPSPGSRAPSSGPPSRRVASRASERPDADTALLSLRGLLAARRLTRELKVPLWSARPEVKFPCLLVEELMRAHLPSRLAGVAYHPSRCAQLAAALSAEIRDLVKAVTPPRYKLVCSVSIGSKGQDDVVVSSQSLWDPYADSFATSQYVNPTLFCVALVYAIYLE
ncbi:PREDICTED: tctex1 domain-containing protein 4-like [Elephantulus edwardii]|uniref:tctex1 domain-containing protein 4-like n=1 Tax=Elephantulus edwardii TaxID=28737 RepID=UPI0003F0BEA3|nr:PREDICTED: tctex1 domain-containing protein 4-like [Elephantulus edwardii]